MLSLGGPTLKKISVVTWPFGHQIIKISNVLGVWFLDENCKAVKNVFGLSMKVVFVKLLV